MSNLRQRPIDLPSFANPPLDEVVIGVQFAPIPNYTSIHSHGIWRLFKEDFPTAQEHPRIAPQFETFGGSNPAPNTGLRVGPPQGGNRIWFLSKTEDQVIQFQQDKLLTNWRKRPSLKPYPRFEICAQSFEDCLERLSEHCQSEFSYSLDINQAEVSYINIIPVEDFSEIDFWSKHWSANASNVEALNINFSEVVERANGAPYARLSCVIQSVYTVDRKNKGFSVSLTFRGRPDGNNMRSAMDFIVSGRRHIVSKFEEMTTNEAHQYWGKQT